MTARHVTLPEPYHSLQEAERRMVTAQDPSLGTPSPTFTGTLVPVNPWKRAIINACVLAHINWDEEDPAKTLHQLLVWESQVALDPKVSSDAQALINRGRQEMLREVMETLTEHRDNLMPSDHRILELYFKHARHEIRHSRNAILSFVDELLKQTKS